MAARTKASVVLFPTKRVFWNASLSLPLPKGDEGTYATVLAMKAVAEHAAETPPVQQAARIMAQHAAQSGTPIPVVLYRWLNDHQTFTADAKDVEHLRHPAQLIDRVAAGERLRVDCDDIATLACAMLKAVDLKCGFVILAKREYPGRFVHVFYCTHQDNPPRDSYAWPEGTTPKGFTPWDPQEAKRVPMGKMAKGRRLRVFPC